MNILKEVIMRVYRAWCLSFTQVNLNGHDLLYLQRWTHDCCLKKVATMQTLKPQHLTPQNFSNYGDVIETKGHKGISINSGNCLRYHNLASLDMCDSGVAGISLFDARPCPNPIKLAYVERHPRGSQAFLPTGTDPYLIIVADDADGVPATPKVFKSSGYQGVNYHRNVWHGVLTPVVKQGLFVVVDYIGDMNNLEEYHFDAPYLIDFM